MDGIFKCDVCGADINNDDGFLCWREDYNGGYHDFKITHRRCLPKDTLDINIEDAYSIDGRSKLILMVERGDVADFASWAEVFKRFHTPNYEEARPHLPQAKKDGFFEGASDEAILNQESLLAVIQQYGQKINKSEAGASPACLHRNSKGRVRPLLYPLYN